MFFYYSLSHLLILASVCTAAYAQAFAAGKYIIMSAPYSSTAILQPNPGARLTFTCCPSDAPYGTWDVQPTAGGFFTLTNTHNQYHVFATSAVAGTLMTADPNVSTPFSIAASTNGTWLLQVANTNLFWTQGIGAWGVRQVFLQQGSGVAEQNFVFTPVA